MSIFYLAAVASAVTMMPTQPDQAPQALVVHEDLNLVSVAGQQRLDRRIKTALKMVCNHGDFTLAGQMRDRKCRKRALAEIEPQRELAIAKSGGVKVASKF